MFRQWILKKSEERTRNRQKFAFNLTCSAMFSVIVALKNRMLLRFSKLCILSLVLPNVTDTPVNFRTIEPFPLYAVFRLLTAFFTQGQKKKFFQFFKKHFHLLLYRLLYIAQAPGPHWSTCLFNLIFVKESVETHLLC